MSHPVINSIRLRRPPAVMVTTVLSLMRRTPTIPANRPLLQARRLMNNTTSILMTLWGI